MKARIVVLCVMAGLVSAGVWAAPKLVNPSFEEPDTNGGEYDNGLNGFPGWTEVGGTATSGHQKIVTSALATDGKQIASLRGLWSTADTSGITQVLTDTYKAGTYTLTFDAVSLGGVNARAMLLAGTAIIATQTYTLTTTMQEYSISVTLLGTEAAIGQTIGVRLSNNSNNGGTGNRVGFDNVSFGGNKAEAIYPEAGDQGIASPVNLQWKYNEVESEVEVAEFIVYLDTSEALVTEPNLPIQPMLIGGDPVSPSAHPTDPNFVVGSRVYSPLADDTTYYWRVDTEIYEPNFNDWPGRIPSDANIPVYNIYGGIIEGDVWNFVGPLNEVIINDDPANVFIQPDPTTHQFAGGDATFTIDFAPAAAAVQWFRADNPGVPLVDDDVNYDISTPGDGTSALTVIAPDTDDNDEYYAEVTHPVVTDTKTSNQVLLRKAYILRHRYDFNGNVSDIAAAWGGKGGANGTVVDPADPDITFAAGQLEFGPNLRDGDNLNSGDPNAHYVQLPAGIISDMGNTGTILCWFTWKGQGTGTFSRIFDFGSQRSETDPNNVDIYYTTNDGTDTHSSHFRSRNQPGAADVTSRPAGTGVLYNPANDPGNPSPVQWCLAVVWNGNEAGTGTVQVSLNGAVLAGSAATNQALYQLLDTFNYIGRSQDSGNDIYTGSFNELRIYDIPLNNQWIAAAYAAGPDNQPNPCINTEILGGSDTNGDCVVDMTDFIGFAENWLKCGLHDCIYP